LFYPVTHSNTTRPRELHDDHESFGCTQGRRSGISASLGDGRSHKIAHCVGDVDKSTFSENLGAGVDRPQGIDRVTRRPERRLVGGCASQVRTKIEPGAVNHQYAENFIAVEPARKAGARWGSRNRIQAGTKGRS
jgi:hypothetical protein